MRSAYELTEDGDAALQKWLRSSGEAPPRFRHEGMLRLYFADALSPSEQLQLVRRLCGRVADFEAELRTDILPLAEGLAEVGTRFPSVVARFGVDAYAFVLEWLDKLESELEAELRQHPARRSAAAPRP